METGFKLRQKVYTANGKSYLVAGAIVSVQDLLGKRVERVKAFATTDEETLMLDLSVDEYNALPYRWFQECGEAEKVGTMRPVRIDVPTRKEDQ